MIKKIISLLLISTQAFAGLPTTSVKGQSDTSPRTKFQFQAPHNQITNLGGIKTLIETGNGNILPDMGFESAISLWTASGGAIATTNATAKGTGSLGYDWDSNSASQTLMSTSVTIPNGLQGKNGVASCQIKTVSGIATHTIVVNDGTNDIGTPLTIGSSTTSFQETKINFVFPSSGTIRLKLASVNANEPEIYIDDCKISLADNIFDAPLITEWQSYTPTFTGFGTVTNIECQHSRVASNLMLRCKFTSGTTTATEARVSLPNSLISADTSKIPSIQMAGKEATSEAASGLYSAAILIEPSVSYVTFGLQSTTTSELTKINGSSFTSSGRIHSFTATVPIQGWSAVSAVSADQTDYDWVSYTPTFTGFGAVTSPECQHSRVASNLMLRCKFTSGTSTSTEARVSLPNSLAIADIAKIPSLQICGDSRKSGVTTTDFGIRSPLCTASLSYVTFGKSTSTTAPFASANGSDLVSNAEVFQFNATIPIQGWTSNQRAPTLVGSSTTDATYAVRETYINTTTACSTGTCSTANNNGFSSCVFVSTGIYDCTFSTPYSTNAFCTVGGTDTWGGNAPVCGNDISTTSTTKARIICRTSGSNTVQNSAFTVNCKGSR